MPSQKMWTPPATTGTLAESVVFTWPRHSLSSVSVHRTTRAALGTLQSNMNAERGRRNSCGA
eukprot:2670472-Rhodomonas_salina.1